VEKERGHGGEQRQRADQLRQEIRALEGRDLQLWSIGLLITLVVGAGFIALIWPNVMWHLGELRLDGRYLPQLIFGFAVLIVLFNIYTLKQRRMLQITRDELIHQVIRSEAAERLSLVDPLTEVFNRRYLERVLSQEVSRADRRNTPLAFAMIDVDEFKSANTRFGHLIGDRILTDIAQLLKRTFRTSDMLVRYGGDEFLVLMGDTDEQQAQAAVERLQAQVEGWNRARLIPGYEMKLSCGVAVYSKGADALEVIEAADGRMYESKLHKSPPLRTFPS
jgi:diguanylate cyclase (GGDEF)-like protein